MKLAAVTCLMLMIFGHASGQEPTPTPEPIREEVVVTANRIETRIGDTPASVVTFSRVEIESTASPTVDDTLRQAAGFSIFRRSSSRNANPTTQGVSLRGVGASGASRSVVLFDGVPVNDPFGGWVQWNRISPVAVENVEILRGGASSLYGDSSLSGAINVMPRTTDNPYTFSADAFGGTQGTISGSGFAGLNLDRWSADVTASSFQTEGYKPVEEAARGPVDVFSGVRSFNMTSRIARDFGKTTYVFLRPSYFGEVRTNGTGLQTNRTHFRQLILGGDYRGGSSHAVLINWRAFGGSQVYDQVFSVVNAARTAESLNRVQRVPAQSAGFSGQISAVFGGQAFLAGIEMRNVRGASDEVAFAAGNATSSIGSGGRETVMGIFVQDFVRLGTKAVVAASVRYDRWKNYAALSATRTIATAAIAARNFPDRTDEAVSPQLSLLYHLSDELSLYASASKSFRSATLNELYRAFRVGNVLTTANENLGAERANNFEGGVTFARDRLSIRGSGFWTGIKNAIANVTLTATPNLITRQRQNAAFTRSAGIEVEADWRFKRINLTGGYLFADSIVTDFPSNPALIGRMIPQVPRHQGTFQARYGHSTWMIALQARGSSEQFDDDLNQFRLEPYAQFDIFASKRLRERMQIYAAIENLFSSRYSIGRTPIRTVSSPVNIRIGVRWN